MHRIDAESATPDDKFTEGSPVGGVPATVVTAAWLNDVQENLAAFIEAAGITLVKGDQTQLLDAFQALLTSALGSGGGAASDYVTIPFKDKVSGVRRYLIFQWVSAGATNTSGTTHNYAITFPTAALHVFSTDAGVATVESVSVEKLSSAQFLAKSSIGTPGFVAFAVGI